MENNNKRAEIGAHTFRTTSPIYTLQRVYQIRLQNVGPTDAILKTDRGVEIEIAAGVEPIVLQAPEGTHIEGALELVEGSAVLFTCTYYPKQ